MKRCLSLLALAVAAALPSEAATFVIPASAYDVLGGKTSDTIVATVTDNGVTADISFTFTATAPGHTGTPALAFTEGTRLGITSSFDQGAAGDNSVNEGEILTITVTSVITSTPAGQTVTAIDFGIPTIDLVRSGASGGTNAWDWSSSAGSSSSPRNSQTGAQTFEAFDGANTFDINGATYTGNWTVDENGDIDASGYRFDTGKALSFTTTITAIPEPTSFALLGLGALSLLARRHR